ncbi:MAG: radical SAM-associated putative lipoprotein [Alistipes sp.]|nr:radical SAM-associated putative lipoprotein [Alistipes sp.]MBQ5393989.1 radical SAM-associated putative lipoprotein [Alistipes sp.]
MKAKFNRWMHLLSFALIGLLGFSACSDEKEEEDMLVLYGVPQDGYIVKGTVTDEAGNPIKGLTVTPFYYGGADKIFPFPSTTTDEEGRFLFEKYIDGGVRPLAIADEDGIENGGEFINDTLSYKEMTMVKIGYGDGRVDCLYEVTANATLKKKE